MFFENFAKFSIISSLILCISIYLQYLINKNNILKLTNLCSFIYRFKNTNHENKKINVALLTNEIPPIVYGGVATWIVNFINMMANNDKLNIIPIFLAYNDDLPEECFHKYPNIRIIKNPNDIKTHFNDIDNTD